MQLQEKYPNRVHAIALNVDFDAENGAPSTELTSQLKSVLQRLDVSCENIICSDPMEAVLGAFEIFGLPAALVFDEQGVLIHRFDGSVEFETAMFPFVEDMLQQ